MQRITKWEDIKGGDIAFFHGEAAICEAIEHMTGREEIEAAGMQVPSHALLFLSMTEVYEALGNGPMVRPKEVYQEDFDAGRLFVFRPAGSKEAKREALDRVWKGYRHSPYGWLQTGVGFPVVVLGRKAGVDLPNPMPLGIICSELVLLYLRELREILLSAGWVADSDLLEFTKHLHRESTDPALLMVASMTDAVPLMN